MIKRAIACLGVALLAVAALSTTAYAADGRALGLSSSKFEFEAESGQKGVGEVTVINEGTERASVRVYAADQVIAEDGSITYVTAGPDANRFTSPATWVTFKLPRDAKSTGNIPYINLDPGERVPVRFTVEVPAGAPPGDRNAILFFEMFDEKNEGEPGVARVSARLGARIRARVKGEIVENVDVQPFEMPSFVIGSVPSYAFTVRNDGNIDQNVDVKLVVLDRSENELGASTVLTDTPVYANTALSKAGTLKLPGLAIGPSHVRLALSYPGVSGVAKTVEKDRTVWAIPLWLLITLAVLLVVFILAGVWAAGRRAAERRSERSRRDAEQAAFSSADEYGDD